MNETLRKVMASDDINAIKNVVAIMAERADVDMGGNQRLLMMKQVQSEVSGSHYDGFLSGFHLALIGFQRSKDKAERYWKLNKSQQRVTLHDWLVLWGEMERRHGKKIRKWFPHMASDDFNDKIFDECQAFLENGGDVFRDLNP